MALFAAVGAAALVATWRIVSRRLAHLDLLERLVAGMLVFISAILGIHLLPLALGILGRGSVAASAAAAALASLAVPRAASARAEPPREPAPSSPRPWLGLAVVVGAVVGAAALVSLRDWLPRVFTAVDTVTFHLPNAARWIQTGTLWQIDQFLPLQAQGYYPNHGELVHLWSLVPFHNEFLVRPVMSALLAGWALAIVATTRELGVAPATRVLAAAALVATPIVALATIPRAMPDILLYATATAGVLFLLRHTRSGRRSDLVLAGLGLGIALGTKWYGVTTAAIVIAVWLGARVVRERARWRRAVADGALVSGVIAAVGGIWFIRNLVEVGNPVFPVEVAPFGVTIFDAPHDTIREQVGFSIVHYAADTDVLADLAAEILDGAGLLVPLAVLLVVMALFVAVRPGVRRTGALAAAAMVLAGAYVVTPYSALGLEGEPLLAEFNTRYLVPALVAAVFAGALAAGRTRMGMAVDVGLAAVALAALPDAFDPFRASTTVTVVLLLGVAAAAVYALLRARPQLPRRALALAAVVVVGLGGIAYAGRTEDRFNQFRYAGIDPVFQAIEAAGDDGLRVGLAGMWSLEGMTPVWPAFGERITNDVEYLGRFEDGFLTSYDDPAAFRDAVREHDLDVVVVGRGLEPQPRVREEGWIESAGYVELTRSRRLILYANAEAARRTR